MVSSNRSTASGSSQSPSVLFVGASDWREAILATDSNSEKFLVTAASTAHDAYQWFTEQLDQVDCIVCAGTLPDTTGIEFLETVRKIDSDLPFILVATDGSEELASRAISAGVTDYITGTTVPQSEALENLRNRIEKEVMNYEQGRTRQQRARQFEALFEDPQTFMWVLDSDGSIRRANEPVCKQLDANQPDEIGEEPFWERSWWEHSAETQQQIHDSVLAARNGEVVQFETDIADSNGDTFDVEVSFRPVFDSSDSITTIIVEGVDRSERADLKQELQASEELHRVTLNNMTDTVLITNDVGEFTYICPNVHFIFGYTVEEIRELGTIDALLGDNLFDPEELEAEGVLSNIETVATDKAGREHTLLVNVREVSIQGGTTLYSCRDITKRKERERALTALHQTSRELLYAETEQEIAQQIIEDSIELLELPGSAVFLFDSDQNVLRSVAHTDSLEALHGPVSTLNPQETSLVGRSFIEQTTVTYDDVHNSEYLHNPATDLRSTIVIPLGDHGVFLAASDEIAVFDEVTEEIANLLAATAEAALDRVEREVKLRKRDRELQQQNRQLTRLNRTNTVIREIDQSLVQADSHEEIEHAVCERLTEGDRFTFAWVGAIDDNEAVNPRAWAGADQGYLDMIDLEAGGQSSEPAIRTVDSRDPTVVVNVGKDLQAGTWRKAALSRGYQSVASVPLEYEGFTYGVLTVYANQPNAFDEMTRTVLYEMGETVASAIRSAERKAALLSDTVTQLEYRITDSKSALYTLAHRMGGSLELKGGIRSTAEGIRMLIQVDDCPLDRFVRESAEMVAVEAVRPVVTTDDGGLAKVTVATPFLGAELADFGAVLQSLRATPSEVRMTIDIPQPVDVHEIDKFITTKYNESELVAQRERDRQIMTERQFQAEVLDAVTDRQLEVIQTAYYGGYFDTPRQNSGKDVAKTLDISASAFYNHIRKVQQKLFMTLFEHPIPLPNRGG